MIYYTDIGFDMFDINPFSGAPYDEDWILLSLTDNAEFSSKTGNCGHGIFRFVLSKSNANWRWHFMDFIEYEIGLGRNVIVAADEKDVKDAKASYFGHNIADKYLREYEKPFLVHSTDSESYDKILSDGCLKSWNVLKKENQVNGKEPIGRLLGDPEDYSDYIMFSDGGYYNELVVMSKQKGEISPDIDAPYAAGARMYFSAAKIAADVLLLRDGAHLKVKDRLPLNKYLLWTATPDILKIPQKTTPREFGEKADTCFLKFIRQTR